MKCEIVFGKQNESSVAHLPEVLNNLEVLNKTIITINKNSGDICTTEQLCAAAAFHHHQQKLPK
jgi:hypothetical protein